MAYKCTFQDSVPKSNPATAESNSGHSMEHRPVPSRSGHQLHPSIEKENRAEPSADPEGGVLVLRRTGGRAIGRYSSIVTHVGAVPRSPHGSFGIDAEPRHQANHFQNHVALIAQEVSKSSARAAVTRFRALRSNAFPTAL